MGRAPGTGRNDGWTRHTTLGGQEYLTRPDDPGFGYIDKNQNGRGDADERYPLWYIDFVYSGSEADTPSGSRTRETETPQYVRELTASGLSGAILVPYGRASRVGGSIAAWASSGTVGWMYLHLGHGPIGGNWRVKIDDSGDEQLTGSSTDYATDPLGTGIPYVFAPTIANSPFFTFRIGEASPAAVDRYFARATRGRGPGGGDGVELHPYLAGVGVRFETTSSSPDIPRMLFSFDGRLLRDPRLGVDGNGIPNQPEAYSDLPTLALADYYTSQRYGLHVPDEGINWESVAECADFNETKGHAINWAILRGTTHRAIIDAIRALGRINVIRRDGKRVFVPQRASSRLFTYTPDNSRPVSIERVAPSTIPNVVRVSWTNPAKNYETDYAYAPATGAPADGRPPIVEDYALEGCTDPDQAQRAANWLYAELRSPLIVTLEGTTADALQHEPGDRVGYYSPTALLGTSAAAPQDLRIRRVAMRNTGTVLFTAKLYDEDAYDDTSTRPDDPKSTVTPLPMTDPPPNPIAGSATVASGNATGYWTKPPVKSTDKYGAGYWSSDSLVSLDAAKVNDGVVDANVAVEFAFSGSYLVFDAGVGTTKDFREVDIRTPTGSSSLGALTISYSDDGAAWTDVTSSTRYDFGYSPLLSSQSLSRIVAEWASVGGHRYWRISAGYLGGGNAKLAEVQFREWLNVDYPYVAKYRIYNRAGELLLELGAAPTSSAPANFAAWLVRTGNWWLAPVIVKTVNLLGLESDGIEILAGTNAGYATQVLTAGGTQVVTGKTISALTNTISNLPSTTLTDSAALQRLGCNAVSIGGAQDDYDGLLDDETNLIQITPTGSNVLLYGLTRGREGRMVIIRNASSATTPTLVIYPEKTTSAAGNRFTLVPGVTTLTLARGEAALFVYDSGTSRWVHAKLV